MKLKQTVFFACLVALVVAYTIYDYSKVKYQDKNKIELNKIFPNKNIEDLKEFKLTNNLKTIFIKKVNKTWQILAPINYTADQEYMGQIVSLLELPLEKITKVDGVVFNEASINIGLKLSDGSYKDFLVSGLKTPDGKSYIQDIKTKEIFVASSSWLDLDSKGIFDFRWKNIFVLTENINKIILHKKNKIPLAYIYEPKNKIWQSASNKNSQVADKQIAQFLSELLQIKVYRFVSEVKTDQILKKYYLDQPIFKIGVEFNNEELNKWGLLISKAVGDIHYGAFVGKSQIFELHKSDVAKIKTHLNNLN